MFARAEASKEPHTPAEGPYLCVARARRAVRKDVRRTCCEVLRVYLSGTVLPTTYEVNMSSEI